MGAKSVSSNAVGIILEGRGGLARLNEHSDDDYDEDFDYRSYKILAIKV